MARPKKSEPNESATVKIENAFWKLLETERYVDITVLRISQESGTNRNSFYYHYRDIDDLARQAFMNNAGSEVSKILISALLSAFQKEDGKSPFVFDPSILPHSKRIMLCAGSDSPFMNRLVMDLLRQIWFDALSIQEELLTANESMQVTFLFAGLVAVLGSREIRESPLSMAMLAQSEIGKAIISTMKGLAAKQAEQG